MKNIYETLEMNIIQDKIMRFCASSLGKQEVQKLQIFDDEDDVNEALDKVDEAMKFIDRQGRLPENSLPQSVLARSTLATRIRPALRPDHRQFKSPCGNGNEAG